MSYILATQLLPRYFALSYEAKNVTVVLQGCNDEDCEIKGTLKINPFTLEQFIVANDGSEKTFNYENVSMMVIPHQENSEG